MNKLEEARIKINEIDYKMLELFEKRMEAVLQVVEYKMDNSLPVTDLKREEELFIKNSSMLKNGELLEYYRIFFEGVLNSSKAYQRNVIK